MRRLYLISISLLCYILIWWLWVWYWYNNVVIWTLHTIWDPYFDSYSYNYNQNLYWLSGNINNNVYSNLCFNNWQVVNTNDWVNTQYGTTYDRAYACWWTSIQYNADWQPSSLYRWFQIQLNWNFWNIINWSNEYWRIRGGTYKQIWFYYYNYNDNYLTWLLYEAGSDNYNIPTYTVNSAINSFNQWIHNGEININKTDNTIINLRFKVDNSPVITTWYWFLYNTWWNTIIFKEKTGWILEYKYFNCIKFYIPDYKNCTLIWFWNIIKTDLKDFMWYFGGIWATFLTWITTSWANTILHFKSENLGESYIKNITTISWSTSSNTDFFDPTDEWFGIYTWNDWIWITSTNNTISSIFNCDINWDWDVNYLTEAPLCPITILWNWINIISNWFDNISNSFEIIMSIWKEVNNNQTLLSGNNAWQWLVIPFWWQNSSLDSRFLFLKRFIYLFMFV